MLVPVLVVELHDQVFGVVALGAHVALRLNEQSVRFTAVRFVAHEAVLAVDRLVFELSVEGL